VEHPGSAAAQWVAVEETLVGRKPRAMAFKDAACLGSSASAVLEAFEWMKFNANEDKTILVLGGASDVGSLAIQYCKAQGWFVIGNVNVSSCHYCFLF
jgi:NADPH:quinone reductase-like Zn-dependent oxidoreductase